MPPANDYDHWIETMPWDKVLSLSDPVTTFGALFVPGRHDLDALQDVHLDVVNRTLTKLDGGNESWIFLADQPARLQLEIVAGSQGIARPFVDVRVSKDGSPSTAIQRSVFRIASFGANERRVVPVELPPEVLRHCATSGAETCVSLRVIEQSGETYAGAEVRACFHVVRADTVLMETAGALREAPELDDLAALERQIPRPAIPSGLSAVDWSITITNRSKTPGLAKYLPVQQRGNGDSPLEGGIAISSIGLADLARRAHENDLTADELARFAQALDDERPFRHRLSLNLRETVEPQLLARSERGLGVRTEFGWLGGYLVSFSGAGPDGNPSRRDVRSVVVPVPRGIALEEV
jgi:hypothetical protein